MFIIFLDVDGVLNHRAIFQKVHDSGVMTREVLDDECIHRLKKIVDSVFPSSIEIVLSSSWRFDPEHVKALVYRLSLFGLRIASQTTLEGHHRGAQIKEWLDARPQLVDPKILILDDDSDMLPEQLPFFVQTNMDTGLTDGHVDRALEILGINPSMRVVWSEEETQVVCFCKKCSKQTLHVGMFENKRGNWLRKCAQCNDMN